MVVDEIYEAMLLEFAEGARVAVRLEIGLRRLERHFEFPHFLRGKPPAMRAKETDEDVGLPPT